MMELLEKLEKEFGSLQDIRTEAIDNSKRLLEFLLQNGVKEKFFIEIGQNLVFKKDDFLDFLKTRLLASSYTKFKNKIGLSSNDEFLKTDKRVVLNFAYKDCVLKGAQSKDIDKSDEIFFNEILASDEIDRLFEPKALHNFELIDMESAPKDSILVDSASGGGAA